MACVAGTEAAFQVEGGARWTHRGVVELVAPELGAGGADRGVDEGPGGAVAEAQAVVRDSGWRRRDDRSRRSSERKP